MKENKNIKKPEILVKSSPQLDCSLLEVCKTLNVTIENEPVQNYKEHNTILLRGGISLYTVDSIKLKKAESSPKNGEDILRKLKASQQYIDSPIHEIGIQQAVNAQKYFNCLDIHTVFVSPLLRTLQSAYYLFQNHPNRENITFKVTPLTSDILRNSASISDDVNMEIRNYFQTFKFDFTEFDEYQLPSLWQVQQLEDQELQRQLTQEFWQSDDSFAKTMVKQMNKIYPKQLESYSMCLSRANKFREYLKSYRINNNVKQNQKLCVISHHSFLKCFQATEVKCDGFVEGPEYENFMPTPYDLQ